MQVVVGEEQGLRAEAGLRSLILKGKGERR